MLDNKLLLLNHNQAALPLNNSVKEGCALAPTLFGTFFAVLLDVAFVNCPGDVSFHWRLDGPIFNLARPKARTFVRHTNCTEFLLAHNAALVVYSAETLQKTIN